MTKTVFRGLALILPFGAAAFSQTASVLVGAGYSAPDAPLVAPGQVLTLYYRDVSLASNGELRTGRAQAPLPALLAGISAQITQERSLFNVPLLEVRQQNTCQSPFAGPACLLTSVKVQVPFEVAADVTQDQPAGAVSLSPMAQLVLYADGEPVATAPLQPVPDRSHVLTSCDLADGPQAGKPCGRVAFHADGTPVTAESPAVSLETIRVLVYGLGQTAPAAVTGVAAQPGYALTDVLGQPRVKLSLTPFVNALASAPGGPFTSGSQDVPVALAGAALRSGAVGVYELAVAVPASLSPPLPCGGDVRSNYVLNVITSLGAEPVPVCIAE